MLYVDVLCFMWMCYALCGCAMLYVDVLCFMWMCYALCGCAMLVPAKGKHSNSVINR